MKKSFLSIKKIYSGQYLIAIKQAKKKGKPVILFAARTFQEAKSMKKMFEFVYHRGVFDVHTSQETSECPSK